MTDATESGRGEAGPPPGPEAGPGRAVEAVVAEFVEHLRLGLDPDPDRYLLEYPDLATELDGPLRAALALHRLHAPPTAVPPSGVPGRVGRYEVRGVLGRGASGVVVRALDPRTDREVALKLTPGGPDDPTAAARFERAARVLGRLRHPHIVPVREAGQAGGWRYVELELVAGESLEDRLARGAWRDDRAAAALVRAVASALGYAHRNGVVHRDVKPANILLDGRGEPLLTDFGLARDAGEVTLTAPGQLLGTPAYMAPEQVREAHAADGRSDIYALGVVLYRLLTRRLPFEGCRTPAELAYRHALGPPPPPRSVRPDVSPDLDLICRTAIDPDPSHRFPTADAFADELGRWLAGESLTLRSPAAARRAWRWYRRQPRLTRWLLSVLLVLVLTAPFAGWAGWNVRVAAELAAGRAALAENQARAERETRAQAESVAILDREWAGDRAPSAGHRARAAEDADALLALLPDVPDPTRRDLLILEARSLIAESLMAPDVEVVATLLLPKPGPWLWPADVHPTGKWAAVGTSAGPIRFEPGNPPVAAPGGGGPADRVGVRFAPDGRFLFVTPPRGGLEVWDGGVTRPLAQLIPPTGPRVLDVTADAGGRVLAALADGSVRAWAPPDFHDAPAGFAGLPPGPWPAARFDPAARLAVAGPDGVVTAHTAGGGGPDPMRLDAGGPVVSVAWSPEGGLAAGTADGEVAVWDGSGRLVSRHTEFVYGATALHFSPGGEFLLAGNPTEGTRAWDAVTGEVVLGGLRTASGFSGDGLVFTGSAHDRVDLCRLRPGAARRLGGFGRRVDRLCWSGDGRHLAGLDTRFGVAVWDVRSGQRVDAFRAPRGGLVSQNAAVALSADGSLLAYAGGGEESSPVLVRDVRAGRTIGPWTLPGGFERLAGPAADRFMLAREQFVGETQVLETVAWQVQTDGPPVRLGVVRRAEPGDVRRFIDASLSADGRWYVWSGPRLPAEAGRVEVREVPTGRLVSRVKFSGQDGQEPRTHLAGGRWLWVSGTKDGVLRYDLATGDPPGQADWLPDAVTPGGDVLVSVPTRAVSSGPGVAFLPGGRVASGLVFHTRDLPGGSQPVLSPDGRVLAYPSGSGTVTVVDLPAITAVVDEHFGAGR